MMPFATGTFVLLMAAATAAEAPRNVASFRLQDGRGAWHELPAPGESKLVVLAFVGTECPLAELYAPRLAELARAHRDRGVSFLAIDANAQDSPSALARFAATHDLPFPLLKDVGNALADRLG